MVATDKRKFQQQILFEFTPMINHFHIHSFRYSTGNNINAEETGFLKEREDQKAGGSLVQHGRYSYDTPEGENIVVEYTADEHGFRATGAHIPTPPPVSPEIQKGLDLIYAGIEANRQRSLKDPEFAKRQQEREQADYYGQYIPS